METGQVFHTNFQTTSLTLKFVYKGVFRVQVMEHRAFKISYFHTFLLKWIPIQVTEKFIKFRS